MRRFVPTLAIVCIMVLAVGKHVLGVAPSDVFATPVTPELIDPAAFAQGVDGVQSPLGPNADPQIVLWTQDSPAYGNVTFGVSKTPGERHLRIGFKQPLAVGTVLVRGGGRLGVLKPDASYPGNLHDDTQWIPAQRLQGGKGLVVMVFGNGMSAKPQPLKDDGQVIGDEVAGEEYAMWVLPPGTRTRALRFTHAAAATDNSYGGELGGAYILTERLNNIAPQAVADASARVDAAWRLNNNREENAYVWDNRGADDPALAGVQRTEPISTEKPEWITLAWPRPVQLQGLAGIGLGFAAADVQTYVGPRDRPPREATEADWQTVKAFANIVAAGNRPLAVHWLPFDQPLTTSALRLRITRAVTSSASAEGKRVWLSELLAIESLGQDSLKPVPPTAAIHPPIPVRFNIKDAGYVTLVIEDAQGQRVRNLVSETPFPAGDNVVWWDGMDDVDRDFEAPSHGIYRIPGKLVPPGSYRFRGLWRPRIDLHYELCAYNPGTPAWNTLDHSGGWLANHTPPSSTLFVPAGKSPANSPVVLLGSHFTEGGDGLAWVDLSGRKLGGKSWIGGDWTGAQFLAYDAGNKSEGDVYAYVGAVWNSPDPKKGEVRLTALTRQADRAIFTYTFTPATDIPAAPGAGQWGPELGGIAVRDGLLVFGLPHLNKLVFVDVRGKQVLATTEIGNPRGLAFDSQGRLLVLSGSRLNRYTLPAVDRATTALPAAQVLVEVGLEDPQQLALDAQGNIYVSDRGASHQVKVFTSDGKSLPTIGKPGKPAAGPYDPDHMNNPNGLTIDSSNHLWVAETDYLPKRVSVWTLDGKLVNAFYGPSKYGGGGEIDPLDKSRFYYADGPGAMELRLDWEHGASRPISIYQRNEEGAFCLPCPAPQTPIYFQGRQYMTNTYNTDPTNGAPVAGVWLLKGAVVVPVAAVGQANGWAALQTDAFKSRLPKDVDLNRSPAENNGRNSVLFVWSDLNGNGKMEPEEVSFIQAPVGYVCMMPDLSAVTSFTTVLAPRGFAPGGAPIYNVDAAKTVVPGARSAYTSGGGQVLLARDGWTVLTIPPAPLPYNSMCGALNGKPMWTYPSLWPGLHPSHSAPVPEFPGELIGTTRLLGPSFTPPGEAGELWAINGNMGNMYVLTTDGLFVATIFHDTRQAPMWIMPYAKRGMLVNDLSLQSENFWPSITRTSDGGIILVDGARNAIVRVEGLDRIRRLPPTNLNVTPEFLTQAAGYYAQLDAQRKMQQGRSTLQVAMRSTPPVLDGKLDDWAGADWATIDVRMTKVGDWSSKEERATAAVTVSGDRLYAAFITNDAGLLKNSGENPVALFKTGGALDLMIGADPKADPHRQKPVRGDLRLLVTQVGGKMRAMLYRPVVPGTKDPVPFSSPWRTITIDRVDDVSSQVQLVGSGGCYELSIPLATLGLQPADGQIIRADIGLLRGNGSQTIERIYWQNKATAIVSDVPDEAMLTPQLWGNWRLAAQPQGK